MSERGDFTRENDEIDEILIKIQSGRTVVKSLAAKALSFYTHWKTVFQIYEKYYKTHNSSKVPEHKQRENNPQQETVRFPVGKPETDEKTIEEIKRLKIEIENLRGENRKLREEIEKLKTKTTPLHEKPETTHGTARQRSSQIQNDSKIDENSLDSEETAQQKRNADELIDGQYDMVIANDVNGDIDYNIPTQLAEKFRQLFDGEWKHAYDGLVQAMQTNSDEAFAVDTLADILREIDKFCTSVAKQQLENMAKPILEEMKYPKYRLESGDVMGGLHRASVEEHHKEIANTFLIDLRKQLGLLSVGPLYQIFSNYYTKLPITTEEMSSFIMKTTELLWLMKIQEPPMELEWTYPGFSYDKASFTAYRDENSDVVKKCMWPAVFRHLEGPLLSKGVILTK